MNTRQIQYALMLYENLNFSAVADKLGITQPALSKQIHNLEDELGIRLFDRSTSPLTVTPAGEHFFVQAKEILYREDQLLKSMEDFKSGKRGSLVIGVSPFRCQYLLPKVIKEFRKKYPEVQVVLHEAGNDILRKETAEGKFDFSIVNLPVDEAVLDVTPIETDVLVLAVPKEIAKTLPSGELIDLSDCQNLDFITVHKNQEMRQLLEKSCLASGFSPKISAEVVGLSTAFALCLEGVGATLIPLQYVEHLGAYDKVQIFKLQHNLYTRQPVIITRKGQYISEYAKHAIELLTK